jgi:hypothetical protein
MKIHNFLRKNFLINKATMNLSFKEKQLKKRENKSKKNLRRSWQGLSTVAFSLEKEAKSIWLQL